jgi:hypothetical protein
MTTFKTINGVDLTEAEMSFAVANTPLFLVRKLRSDAAVKAVSNFESEEIFADLESALKSEPKSVSERVLPYVLLTALSQKRDFLFLQKSAKLSSEHYRWFSYICKYFIDGHRSTTQQVFHAPAAQVGPVISTISNVSNINIIIPGGRSG